VMEESPHGESPRRGGSRLRDGTIAAMPHTMQKATMSQGVLARQVNAA
jgi:hypothetical protein